MRNLLFNCFGKSDKACVDYLRIYLDEAENYKKNYKIDKLITPVEKDYIMYLITTFESSGVIPSQDLFEKNFPATANQFSKCVKIDDLRNHVFNLLDGRINNYISERLSELNKIVKDYGITPEITDEFNKLQALSNRNKAKDINIKLSAKELYEAKKLRPAGLQTGIREVDNRIGGMSPGTVSTIAGFTSQYKTTFAVNIARLNAYYLGYNIVYISLETPKEDMYYNLLSCHSYETKFAKYNFIGHEKIRQGKLLKEEEDYLYNVVEKDLKDDYTDEDGVVRKRGQIIILDESDFNTFSFGEVSAVIEKVDDMLGGTLDAVFVDYVQLCKFSGDGASYDANSQINSYVTFFRRLAQNFRREIDKTTGEEKKRQLVMVLLAQINRTSWQRAARNEGRYDITCLADANELERGSYRVFTTFTDEEKKARKTAQVQILKNRTGQTMYDPCTVYADGEAYVFMDEDSMSQSFSADGTASIDSAFSMLDSDDLSSLGI